MKTRRVSKKRKNSESYVKEPKLTLAETGEFVIYGLRDPRTDEYKYVGKSSSGINRPKVHLVCSHNSDVNNWINELGLVGKAPFIDIFEKYDNIDILDEKERYWVSKCLESGYKLFNINLLNSVDVIRNSILDSNERNQSEKDYQELSEFIKIIDNVGSIIKNKRFSSGLTQEELSLKAGLHRTVISEIENGKIPSTSSIKKIITALNDF